MGRIFCVMGKSASGKDSIFKELMHDKSLKLKNIVPYTTRPIRDGEQDGKDYIFCTEADVNEYSGNCKVQCYSGWNWNYGDHICAACGKETDSKSGGYLGTAWYSCNFKRCSSEVFRMEQPIKSWKSCGASYNCISGIMGCLSDDDTNFFTDYEKSGTCNTGFAFKSGE